MSGRRWRGSAVATTPLFPRALVLRRDASERNGHIFNRCSALPLRSL